MTHTTKKPMTLEQVLDLIIQAANGESKISRAGCRELADAINAHIATQREGEAVAFDFDEWEAWFSGIGVEDRVSSRLVSRLSWQEAMRKYAQPRASVMVTEDEIDVACIAVAKAYGGTIQPADVDRIAVRAALEAVMSKPHYEVRALYEHPASKTHAEVTDMARKLGDEYFRLCKLADRKPMPAGFWMEQLCTALEDVLKGE